MRIPQSLKNASPSVLHARIHSTPFTRLTPNPLSSSPILPGAPRNVCPSAASLTALCSSLNCKVPMFSQRESLNTPCQQRTHTQSLPLYTDTLERKKMRRGGERAAWAGLSLGIFLKKTKAPLCHQGYRKHCSPCIYPPPHTLQHTHTHTKAKGEGTEFQASLTEIKTKDAAVFPKYHSAHKDEDIQAGSSPAMCFLFPFRSLNVRKISPVMSLDKPTV